MSTRTFIIVILLMGIALGLGGYFFGRSQADTDVATLRQTDTVTIHDTVRIDRPIPVTVSVLDTLLVAVTDTVIRNDTVYVSLPRETRTYGDDRYTAQVSGYKPSLDWIQIYNNTTVIKEKMRESLPCHSIALTGSLAWHGFQSAAISAEYTYRCHNNIELTARAGYDILQRSLLLSSKIGIPIYSW